MWFGGVFLERLLQLLPVAREVLEVHGGIAIEALLVLFPWRKFRPAEVASRHKYRKSPKSQTLNFDCNNVPKISFLMYLKGT